MKNTKLQLKTKILFLKSWPLLLIIGIWFVFSSPYFLRGKVPYPSTYQVNHFPPWSSYEKFWGPVKNEAMPDVIDQIYPWKKFTIDTLKSGQIPFWNPYNFSGSPHLANFQSAVLSPFNLLYFIFPFIDAWSILILLQPLLAAIFMYLLARSFKISTIGALISSISFMFCGFMVVWMAYGTLGYAILYLPLAIFAIEKYFEKKKTIFLLILSLSIPLSFFSGHFQISFYFLITVLLYGIFKSYTTRDIRSSVLLALTIGLGIFLALPQLLPSIDLYRSAVRSEIFTLGEAIPFPYLVTLIAPDILGNAVTRNDWFGHYAEWASFVGIVPFVLALFTLLKKESKMTFFSFLALLSLLLAVNNPLSPLIIALKIPVISTSALSRAIVLFSFSLCVLAGFGLDTLRRLLEKKEIKKIAGILVITLSLLGCIWILLLFFHILPEEKLYIARRNLFLPTMLFILLTLALVFSIKNKKMTLVSFTVLLLLTTFDSLRFAQKWMPFDPREFVFPELPIINVMKTNIGNGRFFGNVGTQVATYYKIPSIEGYDPLYIGRYGEFARAASSGNVLPAERSVVRIDRRGIYTNRLLDILGVSVIFHPRADTNQNWAFPVWEDKTRFSLFYQDDKFELFRNNFALPRAMLFYDYEVIKDSPAIIKRFYSEDFDFRKKLILEEDIYQNMKEGTGTAKIAKYTPDDVIVEVNTTSPALVFLSDNYYPAFQAKVNGQKTKIFRADYTMRAIAVPKGVSRVEFFYENWHL